MKNTLYLQGAAARRELGRRTDLELLKTVAYHPGMTIYELSKILEWSVGRTHGSLQRLIDDRKLVTQVVRKTGRHALLVFPFESISAELGEIRVDKRLFDDPTKWDVTSAFAYCLTKDTVGLSPEADQPWKEKSIFEEKVEVKKDDNQVRVTLNKRLQDFYMIGNTELDIATSNNRVIVSFLESYLPITGKPEEMDELESEIQTEIKQRVQRSLLGYQRSILYAKRKQFDDYSVWRQENKYPTRVTLEHLRPPIPEIKDTSRRIKTRTFEKSP
jgi:hypothetical protein